MIIADNDFGVGLSYLCMVGDFHSSAQEPHSHMLSVASIRHEDPRERVNSQTVLKLCLPSHSGHSSTNWHDDWIISS